ncbi:MAG: peptidase S24 [Bacteroidaceae bacterium]|nr:peptidase S24 [Bacteroidaceae bacterium]
MEKFVPHSIDSDELYDNRLPGDVKVGFSSSSADMRERLDIVKLLVKHRASTFFFRVGGVPISDDTMSEGDIIIVDRAIDPYNGCKAICYIDGEFCVKRVEIADKRVVLQPVSELGSSTAPIEINEQNSFFIWGVVTYVIKKM